MNFSLRSARMALLPVVLVGGLLVACSDDEEPEATATETATEAATETATEAATETATEAATETATEEAASVEVTAIDYGFENLPETAEVGTVLTLTNSSDAELHELVAIRLADDETRTAEELVALSPEEQEALLAGAEPAMVLIAPPGEGSIPVVGDGTLTEAGRYLVICAIPVGADPDEYMAAAAASPEGPPEVEGGAPHFTEGMYGEITVE